MYKLIFSSIIFCLISTSSFAYLGPGVGGGVIAATIGVVLAIIAALFGLIWLPVKRLLKIKLINQLLLFCSAIIIYEFIRYVQLINIVKSNLKMYQKILKLFKFKKVSDFRKEKLILNYSKSLFIVSIKIFAILVFILVFMSILNLLTNSFLNLIISILGIIELSIFFIVYHIVRKKIDAKI